MSKESLSVFMPFYNEEELIEEVVSNCYSYLKNLEQDFEILIIDDGSTDSTPQKADSLQEDIPQVTAVHHEVNKGYGRALATGFDTAQNPLVFYTDGDGQFDITELGRFLDSIETYDLVIGYRTNRKDDYSRILTSKGFNILARFLLPIDSKDIDCAFKLVRKDAVDDIELKTERTTDAELLTKASEEGFDIKQVPVTHLQRDEGESEAEGLVGVRISLIVKTLKEILQIRRDISR